MSRKKSSKEPKPDPYSLRLDAGMNERLAAVADKVRMGRQKLAQEAVHAAIRAIEEHGGRLVLPVHFTVEFRPDYVPAKANPTSYEIKPERVELNEGSI